MKFEETLELREKWLQEAKLAKLHCPPECDYCTRMLKEAREALSNAYQQVKQFEADEERERNKALKINFDVAKSGFDHTTFSWTCTKCLTFNHDEPLPAATFNSRRKALKFVQHCKLCGEPVLIEQNQNKYEVKDVHITPRSGQLPESPQFEETSKWLCFNCKTANSITFGKYEVQKMQSCGICKTLFELCRKDGLLSLTQLNNPRATKTVKTFDTFDEAIENAGFPKLKRSLSMFDKSILHWACPSCCTRNEDKVEQQSVADYVRTCKNCKAHVHIKEGQAPYVIKVSFSGKSYPSHDVSWACLNCKTRQTTTVLNAAERHITTCEKCAERMMLVGGDHPHTEWPTPSQPGEDTPYTRVKKEVESWNQEDWGKNKKQTESSPLDLPPTKSWLPFAEYEGPIDTPEATPVGMTENGINLTDSYKKLGDSMRRMSEALGGHIHDFKVIKHEHQWTPDSSEVTEELLCDCGEEWSTASETIRTKEGNKK